MQVKDKLFCPFSALKSLSEEIFVNSEIVFRTVSFTDRENELMIFLDRDVYHHCYKVRIYKSSYNERHNPHAHDNAIKYDENDEYTTVYFETYNNAKNFISNLAYNHREYHKRPYRKIINK